MIEYQHSENTDHDDRQQHMIENQHSEKTDHDARK